jgi:hypothetical protein
MAEDPKDDAPGPPENRQITGEASRHPAGARQASGRFAPGSTGNAGGRPSSSKEFRDLARDMSIGALRKLYVMALSGKGLVSERACEFIIERAWGRTPLEVSGPRGGPIDMRFHGAVRSAIEQAIADELAAAAGGADPDDPKN